MALTRNHPRVLTALSVVAALLVPLVGLSAPAAQAASEVHVSHLPEDGAHSEHEVLAPFDAVEGVADQDLSELEADMSGGPSEAPYLVPSLVVPHDDADSSVVSRNVPEAWWRTHPRDLTRIERTTSLLNDFSAGFSTTPGTTGEYRWQMSVNGGATWSDIAGSSRTFPGGTSSHAAVMNLDDIWYSMNGNRYRVMITTDRGNVLYSDPALLTVLPGQVAINAHPSPQSVTERETAVFSARHGGASAPAEVRWQRSDDGAAWTDVDGTRTPVDFDTETSLAVEAPFGLDGTSYRAVFSNARTEAATNPARLTVVPLIPAVSTHPGDVSVTEGQPVTFTSAYTGTDAPTSAQWQFSTDGGQSWSYVPGGATDPDLTIDRATLDMDGWQYRVRYTNASGSRWSEHAYLSVVVARPVISEHPADGTVHEGAAATLSGAFTGTDAPTTAQWQFSTDGGQTFDDVPGSATQQSLTLGGVTREMDGWQYRVRFTNSAGSAWSDAATLRVTFDIPAAEGAAAPGESVELRIYDPESVRAGVMTISAPTGTAIESVRHDGPDFMTFAIDEDGTTAISTGSAWGHSSLSAWVTLRVADDVAPGSVLTDGDVQVVDADVLVARGSLAVTVSGEIEILGHPGDVTVDVGTAAEFTTAVSGHGVSTQWQVSTDEGTSWVDVEGGTSTTLILEATTPEMNRSWYRAVHTNAAGQVATDHAVLLVRTAPYFTDHPKLADVYPTGSTAVLSGRVTDNVTTFFYLSWEYSTDGETWIAYENGTFPDALIAPNLLLLFPLSAEMDGLRFRAVAENHLGRTVSDPALLTVSAAPVLDSHPADVRTLVGREATFSASTPAVSPHRTQQWQERTDGGDWTDIPGATDATYSAGPTTLEMDQREYRIVFTNHHGSTASESATLTVRASLPATVTVTPTIRLVDSLGHP